MTVLKTMIAATLVSSAVVTGALAGQDYTKFDADLPDETPKLFAPGVFGNDKSYIGYQSFDATGERFYYVVTNKEWNSSSMFERRADNPAQARKVEFLRVSWEGEPFISGRRFYFTAILPPGDKPWHSDLYVAERKGEGWSAPKLLPSPVNTLASEWHVSATKTGVLYFCSERDGSRLHGDIFRASPAKAGFRVKKLPDTVNSAENDCDPLIAHDESWLIFHSDRPGGFGAHDLYISLRDRKGRWSNAVNMGPDINTDAWEMAPSLTPDGKYLMFVRRKAFVTDEPSRIWWVSARIIERFRPRAR